MLDNGTRSPDALTPTPARRSVTAPPAESTRRTLPGTCVTGSENVISGNTAVGTPPAPFFGSAAMTPGGPGSASVVDPPAPSTRNTFCSVTAGPNGGSAVAVIV